MKQRLVLGLLFGTMLLCLAEHLSAAQSDLGNQFITATSPIGRFLAMRMMFFEYDPDTHETTESTIYSVIDADMLRVTGQAGTTDAIVKWHGQFAMNGDGSAVAVAAFSPEMRETIEVFDLRDGTRRQPTGYFLEPTEIVNVQIVALNTTGNLAAYAERDSIAVWNQDTGEEWRLPGVLHGEVVALAWSPVDDRLLAAISPSYDEPLAFQIWDVQIENGRTLATSRLINPGRNRPTGYAGTYGGQASVAWSFDRRLVALTRSHGFDIYDADSGEFIADFQMEFPMATAGPIAWNRDSSRIATSNREEVVVWDTMTGLPVTVFPSPGEWVWAMVWREDDSLLYVSGGRVYVDGSEVTIDGLPQGQFLDFSALS